MTDNLKKRKRKVNLKGMSGDQQEVVGFELAKKVSAITDEAAGRINEILKIYGLKAKIAVQLTDGKGKPLN